jgi:hypothetical protein
LDPGTCPWDLPASTHKVGLREDAGVQDLSKTEQLAKFTKDLSAQRRLPRRIWKSTGLPQSMHSAKPQKFVLPSDRDSAGSSASNSGLPIAVFALPDFHTLTLISVVSIRPKSRALSRRDPLQARQHGRTSCSSNGHTRTRRGPPSPSAGSRLLKDWILSR